MNIEFGDDPTYPLDQYKTSPIGGEVLIIFGIMINKIIFHKELILKIMMFGAGVIGTTYSWKLSNAGHDVTLFVRAASRPKIEKDGIHIRCRDERNKKSELIEFTYCPVVVDELRAQDNYDLIIVCVRAHQLDEVLPLLAAYSGKADILFFGNNWLGEERIEKYLPAERYVFGFSKLVGGWRTGNQVECIIFDNPELVTMLGERDGQYHTTFEEFANHIRTGKPKTCH